MENQKDEIVVRLTELEACTVHTAVLAMAQGLANATTTDLDPEAVQKVVQRWIALAHKFEFEIPPSE